jgi:hypothetical protein
MIIIFIQLIIALIHVFRLGQIFSGGWYNLYFSYFSDLSLPFAAYFLLSLNEVSIPALRRWYVKAGIIFFLASSAEFCQLFGFEVLGVTFDPIDILAYASGVLIAAYIDVKIFSSNLRFWVTTQSE